MLLSEHTERAIQQLIERLDIHADLSLSLPVPIRQIVRDEGWILQFKEGLSPLYGYAVIGAMTRVMVINADISRPWQRHAMAHELGHVINGDASTVHFCQEWPWLGGKLERKASLTAARILIPDAALREMRSLVEIATVCDVPLDLVHLRIAAAKHLE